MNLYQKIAKVKFEFHQSEIKKTGENKFAGYKYMQLKDFTKPLITLMNAEELLSFVSFTEEVATLTIIDTTAEDSKLSITSPMSEASLKGCHAVQNLGAVQTYIRRYLYMAMFDIVEGDALDGSEPLKPSTTKEVKVNTKMLSDVIARFGKDDAWACKNYNEQHGKSIKELKFMAQESKQTLYTWIEGKVK